MESNTTSILVSVMSLLLLYIIFFFQIRRPLGTLFELLLPVIAILILIGLRFAHRNISVSLSGNHDTLNECRFSSIFKNGALCFLTFDPDPLTVPETPPFNLTSYTIVYTPNNNRSNQAIMSCRSLEQIHCLYMYSPIMITCSCFDCQSCV